MRKLTVYELSLLCELCYFDPPTSLLPRVNCCLTAGDLARALLKGDPACRAPDEQSKASLQKIADTKALSDLLIARYINRNFSTGFAAYAFREEEGGVICAFRGSEWPGDCAEYGADWLDNFRAPFTTSLQYPDASAFVSAFPNGKLLLTGHSKGAHNALYALSEAINQEARCVCFSGQGFSRDQLTEKACGRLRARAVNYVQKNDPVGALFYHPERRIFVEAKGGGHPHRLSSMAFSTGGHPIPARRPLRSKLIEWTTRAIVTTARAEKPVNLNINPIGLDP